MQSLSGLSIVYEKKNFEIILTISNTTEKTIVLEDGFFERHQDMYFVDSSGEKLDILEKIWVILLDYTMHIDYDWGVYSGSLLFLKPGESVNYISPFKYYYKLFRGRVLLDINEDLEFHVNKDEQIYCVITYDPIDNIEVMKALTDEYLVEAFEKKYLLQLEF